MVLSDADIKREINTGRLSISPFQEKNLSPQSYDMTLGKICKVFTPQACLRADDVNVYANALQVLGRSTFPVFDPRNPITPYEFEIPEKGFVLSPGHLYLYACNETLELPSNVCGTVLGKSSLGRLGLDIHICAGFVDGGFHGSLVLEMRCIYPIRVYPNMKICQIKFEYSSKPLVSYKDKPDSKYAGQIGVQESKYHENFNGLHQVTGTDNTGPK